MINLSSIYVAMPNPESDLQMDHWRTAYGEASSPQERLDIWLRACQCYFAPTLPNEAIDITCGAVPGVPLTLGDLNSLDAAVTTAGVERMHAKMRAETAPPAPDPADTARACHDAYANLLAARTALAEAERAHFQATTGGRP